MNEELAQAVDDVMIATRELERTKAWMARVNAEFDQANTANNVAAIARLNAETRLRNAIDAIAVPA